MNKINLDALRRMAQAKAKIDRECSHLDSSDEHVLSLAASELKIHNSASWGSLAPADVIKRYANSAIIMWALQTIGFYCSVRDVGSVLQTPYLVIDSHVLAHELARFSDDRQPYEPDASFMKTHNLVALRHRLENAGCADLNGVAGLEVVAFILNSRGPVAHWSIMFYFCRDNTVQLFDSLGYLHGELAETAYRLFVALNFIPHGATFSRKTTTALQTGSWECGFIAISAALFFSRRIKEVLPGAVNPDKVTADEDLMRELAVNLLKRSQQNRCVSKFRELRMETVYN